MQTEEQSQEGYFNNWISKNICKSAICQPFVEKNTFYTVLHARTAFLTDINSFFPHNSSDYWPHYAGNNSVWIQIILDIITNEEFVDEGIDYVLVNEFSNDGY